MKIKMADPLISVIIVNYNGKKYLGTCLSSLKKQTYSNYEIIVIDNASSDESIEFVRKTYPKIKLIVNDKNYGFAKGCNIGIKSAKGEYIAALNNDTEVDKHWLEELVKVIETNDAIGSCASKLLFYNERDTIDSVGMLLLKDGGGVNRGRNEKDMGQYDKSEEVFGAPAGGALYRKKTLDEVGLFDEDFFMYSDDTDLAWRIRLNGWKCMYVPTAVVYHVYSGSTSGFSLFKLYYGERNRIFTAVKNYPYSYLIVSVPYNAARHLLLLYSNIRGRGRGKEYTKRSPMQKIVWNLVKAWFDALVLLPKMLKKRRTVQSMKKVNNPEIAGWFEKFSVRLLDIP
ncbi:MAG: hypothetical protein MSIBF_06805, partial [Candidatus Altiarchaeales archaeon IMC4]